MTGKITTNNFRDWMPTRIFNQKGKTLVDWCFMDNTRFTHPFFETTISYQMQYPFSLLFRRQTTLEPLEELYKTRPGIPPAGFIFHLSRCGSTLISQMLAASPENIIISEAPPVDFIIRELNENYKVSRRQQIDYLKWLVNAFSQQRNEIEKHFFIKFDSWHTINLDLIQAAFPDVPWIFLYRNPIEIIVSQMRQGGLQMIPGKIKNLLPDLNINDMLQMPAEEYCGRILGQICKNALENINTGKAMLVNYSELPEAVFSKIFRHFRITYADEAIAQMKAVTQFNSKTPQLYFEPDVQSKKQQASVHAHLAAEKFVTPFYETLEKIRLQQEV